MVIPALAVATAVGAAGGAGVPGTPGAGGVGLAGGIAPQAASSGASKTAPDILTARRRSTRCNRTGAVRPAPRGSASAGAVVSVDIRRDSRLVESARGGRVAKTRPAGDQARRRRGGDART